MTILFLCIGEINARQHIVSGRVMDLVDNKSLPHTNLSISRSGEDAIIGYSISDENGFYELALNGMGSDSLIICASHIGYKSESIILLPKTVDIDFYLSPAPLELKEVTVNGNFPITEKGDTISYNVSSFQSQEDRVIADVLKKMPGIEIEQNGRVLYQGNPIQKYYIEGLDLLEGKYALANNNLSAKAVDKVQILENHQPVKLLDSLTYSDKASLNIKLKKDITVAGETRLGTGFSPFLWDFGITPMLFKKNVQFIGTYQTNNLGENVGLQLKEFNIDKVLNNSLYKKEWVNLQKPQTPPFASERWLNNNVHITSGNYLKRMKNDYDIKIGFSYLKDSHSQSSWTQTSFFTESDSVGIIEENYYNSNLSSIKGEVIFEKNTKKKYFKNSLDVERTWQNNNQRLNQNNDAFQLNVDKPFATINNNLSLLFPAGRKLIVLESSSSYFDYGQSLRINPGSFLNILGEVPQGVVQNVTHKSFFTDNSISFKKKIGSATITPLIGVMLNKQGLVTNVNPVDTTQLETFSNNLNTSHINFKGETDIEYKINNWVFTFNIPIVYQYLNVKSDLNADLSNINIQPQISIYSKIGNYWQMNVTAKKRNYFGGIETLYPGYIIHNYRMLKRNSSEILTETKYSYGFQLEFREPISGVFSSTSYYFGTSNKNLIYNETLEDSGELIAEAVRLSNVSYNHMLDFRFSKYIGFLNTNLKIKSQLGLSRNPILLNDNLVTSTNKSLLIEPSLFIDITKWLICEYVATFETIESEIGVQPIQRIITQRHTPKLIVYLPKDQIIEIEGEYYHNDFFNVDKNYFLNLGYRYVMPKKGVNVMLSWNNIFNHSAFTMISKDTYTYSFSNVMVRPSQLILKIQFGIR